MLERPTRARRTVELALTVLALASCAGATGSRQPAPAFGSAPTVSSAVIIDRLAFGRDIPTGGTVTDSAWRVFLDEVVTPRFPGGFSVMRTEGQWRYADGRIQREDGFVLEIYHDAGAPADSVFEAIAREYIRRFNQEAVARTRLPAQQWMYWSVRPH